MGENLRNAAIIFSLIVFAANLHAGNGYFFLQPAAGQDAAVSAALPEDYSIVGDGGESGLIVRVLDGTPMPDENSTISLIPIPPSFKLSSDAYSGEGAVAAALFDGEDNEENAQALNALGFARADGGSYVSDSPSTDQISAASELMFVQRVFRLSPPNGSGSAEAVPEQPLEAPPALAEVPLDAPAVSASSASLEMNTTQPGVVWTKRSSYKLNLNYTLVFNPGYSIRCDVIAPNGSVIATATKNTSGTYLLRTNLRFPAEGKYNYSFACNDTTGEGDALATFAFYFDRTKPSVSDLRPLKSSTKGSEKFIFNVSDNMASPINCSSNSFSDMLTNGNASIFRATLTKERINNVRITCIDFAGNKVSRSFRVVLDTTPPSITIKQARVGNSTNYTITATDRASNILRAEISRDGADFSMSYRDAESDAENSTFSFRGLTAKSSRIVNVSDMDGLMVGADDNASPYTYGNNNFYGGNVRTLQIGAINYSATGIPSAWGMAFGYGRHAYTTQDGFNYSAVFNDGAFSLDVKSPAPGIRKYLVGGYTEPEYGGLAQDAVLREITVDGNTGRIYESWMDSFSLVCGANCVLLGQIESAKYTTDGGAIAAAMYMNFPSLAKYVVIIKTNSTGGVEWRYQAPDNMVLKFVLESPGGFVAFGSAPDGGHQRVFAASLDSDGNLVSLRNYSMIPVSEASVYGAIALSDGGYAVLGELADASSRGFVLKLDSSLDSEWYFRNAGQIRGFVYGTELSDGRIFAAGCMSDCESSWNYSFQEINTDGSQVDAEHQDSRRAGGRVYGVSALPDNNAALVLYNYNYGVSNGGSDFDSEIAIYDRRLPFADWDDDGYYYTGGFYYDHLTSLAVINESGNIRIAAAGTTNAPSLQVNINASSYQIWLVEVGTPDLGAGTYSISGVSESRPEPIQRILKTMQPADSAQQEMTPIEAFDACARDGTAQDECIRAIVGQKPDYAG
jgi:hypothetical protein